MKRDKSKDTRPGGPDERFDRIERMILVGRYDDADHAMDMLTPHLDEIDGVQKRNVRMPHTRKQNLGAREGQVPTFGDEDEFRLVNIEPVRQPLPGADKSAYTEEEWGRIDEQGRRLVYARLELGQNPNDAGNRTIDELGVDYNIAPGTTKDRKRLVRKVKDHVDRWVERHAA